MTKVYEIKWQPQHFPSGTFFRLKPDFCKVVGVSPDEVFEVGKVIRNGIKSYVLRTTSPMDARDSEGKPIFSYDMRHSFNLDHVLGIALLGTGPLLLCDTGFPEEIIKNHADSQMRIGGSRTQYRSSSLEAIVQYLLLKYPVEFGTVFDLRAAAAALENQSFIRVYNWLYRAPKKRVDAWFKANRNRFLLSVRKEMKLEDQLMRAAYDYGDDDFDDFSADSEKPANATNSVGLSHYSADDFHPDDLTI